MKAFLLACCLLMNCANAWACSCIEARIPEKEKIAKAWTQAQLVFTGRVVSESLVEMTDTAHLRTRTGRDTVITRRMQYRKYTFAVTQPLKGAAGPATIEVLTAGVGSSCGVFYKVGDEFVVFAYTVDTAQNLRGVERKITPYYSTGMCTRTKELRYTAAAELQQLRQLAKKG
ncbi:hypothetical protein ACFST9_17500 [Hymenobacter monticola]|uniref:DUF4468 domain-containing protein n=1 Tax=Hymenobacter monticola TaxID=1705399 RepID=A0ABY4AZK7_9BACT|nr:hypothetical protein [Hymenobacter monticola]UOE32299.1 hypothetical protein MTP16_14280 [Hymenobacter monticola]